MKIGSLFSGIGGLELGLERAGLGETVWQCERDPYCRQVLARGWPGVPCFGDVEVMRDAPDVDLICGGFPCQDVSHAGKRAGLKGQRSGLWFHFLRIVAAQRPAWVVVENVYQAWRKWMPVVRRGLGQIGYASVPLRVSAAEVGVWHRRARGFVVANCDGQLLRLQHRRGLGPAWQDSILAARAGAPWAATNTDRERQLQPQGPEQVVGGRIGDGYLFDHARTRAIEPTLARGLHGAAARTRSAAERAMGNAVVPQCAEAVGRLIAAAAEAP